MFFSLSDKDIHFKYVIGFLFVVSLLPTLSFAIVEHEQKLIFFCDDSLNEAKRKMVVTILKNQKLNIDWNVAGTNGKTTFDCALENNYTDIRDLLLPKMKPEDLLVAYCDYPMDVPLVNRVREVLASPQEINVNVKAKSSDATPISRAIMSCDKQMIELLFKNNVSIESFIECDGDNDFTYPLIQNARNPNDDSLLTFLAEKLVIRNCVLTVKLDKLNKGWNRADLVKELKNVRVGSKAALFLFGGISFFCGVVLPLAMRYSVYRFTQKGVYEETIPIDPANDPNAVHVQSTVSTKK